MRQSSYQEQGESDLDIPKMQCLLACYQYVCFHWYGVRCVYQHPVESDTPEGPITAISIRSRNTSDASESITRKLNITISHEPTLNNFVDDATTFYSKELHYTHCIMRHVATSTCATFERASRGRSGSINRARRSDMPEIHHARVPCFVIHSIFQMHRCACDCPEGECSSIDMDPHARGQTYDDSRVYARWFGTITKCYDSSNTSNLQWHYSCSARDVLNHYISNYNSTLYIKDLSYVLASIHTRIFHTRAYSSLTRTCPYSMSLFTNNPYPEHILINKDIVHSWSVYLLTMIYLQSVLLPRKRTPPERVPSNKDTPPGACHCYPNFHSPYHTNNHRFVDEPPRALHKIIHWFSGKSNFKPQVLSDSHFKFPRNSISADFHLSARVFLLCILVIHAILCSYTDFRVFWYLRCNMIIRVTCV